MYEDLAQAQAHSRLELRGSCFSHPTLSFRSFPGRALVFLGFIARQSRLFSQSQGDPHRTDDQRERL